MAEQTKEILKGRTIRTSEEAYEKFRAIAQENFESQGQCFSTLIHLYELEQGKSVLGDRKMEIENFQMHINALLQMFVSSLQMNEDAEDRVKAGMQEELNTKDRIILQLQKERNRLQSLLDQKDEQCMKLERAIADEKNRLHLESANQDSRIQQLNQTISDKNEMIQLLTMQKKELQDQIGDSVNNDRRIRELDQEIAQKNQEYITLENRLSLQEQIHKQELEKMDKQIELIKDKFAFDLEKAILDKERELQLSWEQEKMEYNRKLELYQMKYVTALERIDKIATEGSN